MEQIKKIKVQCDRNVKINGKLRKIKILGKKGKNKTDVLYLSKFIKKQYKNGANISLDLNKQRYYKWNNNGKLKAIYLSDIGLK